MEPSIHVRIRKGDKKLVVVSKNLNNNAQLNKNILTEMLHVCLNTCFCNASKVHVHVHVDRQ